MEMLIVIVAVVVLGLAAMVAAGKLGEMRAEPVRDQYQPPIPADGPVHGQDLSGVRFAVSPRGYDMAEVDDLMARMARELDERDRRLGELGQGRVPGPTRAVEPRDTPQADPEQPEPSPVRQKADRWRGKDTEENGAEDSSWAPPGAEEPAAEERRPPENN